MAELLLKVNQNCIHRVGDKGFNALKRVSSHFKNSQIAQKKQLKNNQNTS
jgi:hypothetical protein